MIFIQPSISPIALSFSFIDIRWYSLAYIFTFIIGSIIIKKLNKRSYNYLSEKQIDSFFIWAVIGVIIGGRLGYVLFYQTNLLLQPLYILKMWNGGMSFHGGLIGMIISIYLFSIKNSVSFFYVSDLVAITAPIGLFFGRLSNFINTELYGRITNFPLAIIYPAIDDQPRHPSQLYEAFFEGIILFIILFIYFNRNIKINKIGNISSFFLIFYSLFRFLIEYVREPDYHIGLFYNYFTMGQLLCIPLFFSGLVIFFRK